MTDQNLKNYMCIDYPGYVVNADNAIKTLGGIERIEKTFQNRNGKLFLNYNPENIFTKVLCSTKVDESTTSAASNQKPSVDDETTGEGSESASRSSMPGLLIKVIKRKTENECSYESRVMGKIERIYSFKKLADFQYLPMFNSKDNYEDFYDNFRFDQLPTDYKNDLLKSKVPLYVLPPFFSRFDDPVNYALKPEPNKKSINNELEYFNKLSNNDSNELDASTITNEDQQNNNENGNSDLICSVRQERSSQALLITFDKQQIPNSKYFSFYFIIFKFFFLLFHLEPSEKLKEPRNELVKKCINELNKLFNDRSCYLKSVLLYITDYTPALLKESLPYVAYYFTTGPWRSNS